jgi:CRP/FNR family transcriptional regulator, nitrogen fixation regulation protein
MTVWARLESATPVRTSSVVANVGAAPVAEEPDAAAKEQVQFLLRGLGNIENYAAGDCIFEDRGNANAVYRVMSGAVALWRRLPNGKRQIIDFRLPGEYFGVVHRPSHTINAEASSDCVVTAYRRGHVDGICDAVPAFHRAMTKLVAEPVVCRNEAALGETRTAKERIAAFLLKLAERAVTAGEISLPLSGMNIGERIGESVDVVNNCLRDLIATGAVAWARDGGLKVTQPALLEGLV